MSKEVQFDGDGDAGQKKDKGGPKLIRIPNEGETSANDKSQSDVSDQYSDSEDSEEVSADADSHSSAKSDDGRDPDMKDRSSYISSSRDVVTYYPNLRRSERVSRPPEIFDTLLIMQ